MLKPMPIATASMACHVPRLFHCFGKYVSFCHTFRATGITDYLTNGGKLEVAQRMAGHSNAKTTGLYDRRNDDISLSEVERIGI